MRYQIYKPNSKTTGCAMNLNYGKSRGKLAFYINAIKQHSWNAEEKKGSFYENAKNPEKSISCKFSPTELGEMVACFQNNIGWSTVHDFNGNKTTISLTPWARDVTVGSGQKAKTFKAPWFGFSISKNGGEPFFCSLSPGEVQSIKVMIDQFMVDFMKEADTEYLNNGKNKQNSNQNESVNDSDDDDEDGMPDF